MINHNAMICIYRRVCIKLGCEMYACRRRNSHGPQEGPAAKGFHEREQERQTFQQEVDASKRAPHHGVRVRCNVLSVCLTQSMARTCQAEIALGRANEA